MDKVVKDACPHTERVADYAFDIMPSEERLPFEAHLASCSLCREELKELRAAWQDLPQLAELAEPPAGLKEEVMSGIFGIEAKPNLPRSRSIWFYVMSAAVIIAIVAGTFWNLRITEGRQFAAEEALTETASIAQLVSLEPSEPADSKAYGIACVLKKGNSSQLVVYVFGASRNQGTDAYQVWLLRNGERSNAGTFKVGEKGIGVLTYAMEQVRSFDAIGITLEPDGNGQSPRGPKKYGSTEPIQWD